MSSTPRRPSHGEAQGHRGSPRARCHSAPAPPLPRSGLRRSWTNTSFAPLVSPSTRLGATESKATNRPLALIAGFELSPPSAWFAKLSTLTRSVVRVTRSWTNTSEAGLSKPYMSLAQLVSPATRLGEAEQKATKRPSALIEGAALPQLPWLPALSTLTRSVVRVWRSWTNTSVVLLVSPGTRLVASEAKATKRPSALTTGR